MNNYLATNDQLRTSHNPNAAAALPRVFPDVSAQKELPVAEFWRVIHKRRFLHRTLGRWGHWRSLRWSHSPLRRSTAARQRFR